VSISIQTLLRQRTWRRRMQEAPTLIWECIDRTPLDQVSSRVRRIMRIRSIVALCVFGLAAIVALRHPLVGLGMCCCCLIVYLNPDAPGAST